MGSEMCIRDRYNVIPVVHGRFAATATAAAAAAADRCSFSLFSPLAVVVVVGLLLVWYLLFFCVFMLLPL